MKRWHDPNITFAQELRSGESCAEDVDDWVDNWHDTNGAPWGKPCELHEYLGLTHKQYDDWVRNGKAILYEIETDCA